MPAGSAQTRTRRQQTVTIQSFGNKIVTQLGRGMIYREVSLRLFGAFTYALAAHNIGTTLGRGDEWSLIQRVDVVANGTDVIRSFTGTQLMMLNRMIYGGVKRVALQMGDGATAAPVFDSTLIIPFWMFQSARPMDTALNSAAVTDLRLEITVDNPANINTANGPTAVAANVEVASYECFFPPNTPLAFSDCRMAPMQVVVPGANSNQLLPCPVTSLYRGFLINQADGTANNSQDTVGGINSVKLVSGTTVFRDYSWRTLCDWQRMRLGYNRFPAANAVQSGVLSNAVASYLNLGKSTRLAEDGWAFLDLCNDGYLTEGIDSQGFAELNLVFDVAAAITVTVIPIQIFPVRGTAAAA